MASFIEAFRRPFRGSPKFEARPQKDALDLLLENFHTLEAALDKLDLSILEERTLPKDEAWKLCVNVAQATELLHNECPALPLPTVIEDAIDIANKSNDGKEKTRVHPSWYRHGFDVQSKVSEENSNNFFKPDGSSVKISTHIGETPARYSEKDKSLIGLDVKYKMDLISESQGKSIYITTVRRMHPRINVSLFDPRENLTAIFPRQDKLVAAVSYGEILGAGPTVLVEDSEKSFVVSGQDKISAKKALEVARLGHFVLREWSTQKDVSDIRNWS